MKAADFDFLLYRRLARTKDVLGAKAEEYASDADRLHNFKAAAALRGKTPHEALLGMLVKHWVSVQDIVEVFAKTGHLPVPSVVDEKIGDAINYLILLEALTVEARS